MLLWGKRESTRTIAYQANKKGSFQGFSPLFLFHYIKKFFSLNFTKEFYAKNLLLNIKLIINIYVSSIEK